MATMFRCLLQEIYVEIYKVLVVREPLSYKRYHKLALQLQEHIRTGGLEAHSPVKIIEPY